MRVFVSTHFAVIVVAALITGGIGFGIAVSAQSWADWAVALGAMGGALFFLAADVGAFLIVAGRSAVHFGSDEVLRARRRRLAYGQILDVECVPSDRFFGHHLRITGSDGSMTARAVFATRKGADRWRSLLVGRCAAETDQH